MDRQGILLAALLTLATAPLVAQEESGSTEPNEASQSSEQAANDAPADADAETANSEAAGTVRGDYTPREKISEDGGVSFPADI